MFVRLLYFFCFISLTSINAQSINLRGKITDSIGNPLPYANVIADPRTKGDIAFAISDEEGRYKLNLAKELSYRITVSYLGYIPQSIEFIAKENQVKSFVLIESRDELEGLTLSYTPPIVVKEDTTTYRVEAFTTGDERKLRDILKKLPDIEVDKFGNVKVHGKKITKVLVENKTFFTGDSKLAVNNIPADAVHKIDILDNYNEVGFLKGLEDSEDLVMNIGLKKDKKRFAFGDIETGGGINERYLIHPAIYYYSPHTTVNMIGDFNNTGNKSFTLKDYLDFEGGYSKVMRNPKIYFSLINDDFAKFLKERDYTSSRNRFGGLSIAQSLSPKIELSSYVIWSDMKNETKILSQNNYLTGNQLIENRTTTGLQKSRFGIGKLKLKVEPNDDTYITASSYIKVSKSYSSNKISTITNENRKQINTNFDADNVSFKQKAEWHKQASRKHTTSTILVYNYQKTTPNINWLTDRGILQGLIPIITQNSYNIFKEKTTHTHNLNLSIKHYWVLNRFNHIYFTLGTQLAYSKYRTKEYQSLEDGSINDFSSANFGNDISTNFKDYFIGIHYKIKKGIVIMKPGLFYHQPHWNFTQFNKLTKKNKALWLPEFEAKVKFNKTKYLRFQYRLGSKFPGISQLANRLTLLSFNSIYQGNESLENELYHNAKLIFFSNKIFKGFIYSLSANYRSKVKNLINSTKLQGINYVYTPLLTDFTNETWNFTGNFYKNYKNYKFSTSMILSIANYENPVNNELITNTSNYYYFRNGFETRFKKLPNIELNYSKSFSVYHSKYTSKFTTDVVYVSFKYDFLKSFIFKSDYTYENYFNKTTHEKSVFNLANASLFYQKESSPWGFEITANNIFDVKFKERNSFSTILVSDKQTYILPRIIMFKISYKL